MAAQIINKNEKIIIKLNDSVSVIDTEMTVIRISLEEGSGTRDSITIHTYSSMAIKCFKNGKLEFKYSYESHQRRGIHITTKINYDLDTRSYWNAR